MNIKTFFTQIKKTLLNQALSPNEREMLFERILEKTQRLTLSELNPETFPQDVRLVSRYARGYRILLQGVAFVIVVMLISGGGLIAAAQQALPGESLYGLKVNFNEEFQSKLYRSPELKAEYSIRRAEMRIEETLTLLGKAGAIDPETEALIAQKLNRHILDATDQSNKIAFSDPLSHKKITAALSVTLDKKAREISVASKERLPKEGGGDILKVTEFHADRTQKLNDQISEVMKLSQDQDEESLSGTSNYLKDPLSEAPHINLDKEGIETYYQELIRVESFLAVKNLDYSILKTSTPSPSEGTLEEIVDEKNPQQEVGTSEVNNNSSEEAPEEDIFTNTPDTSDAPGISNILTDGNTQEIETGTGTSQDSTDSSVLDNTEASTGTTTETGEGTLVIDTQSNDTLTEEVIEEITPESSTGGSDNENEQTQENKNLVQSSNPSTETDEYGESNEITVDEIIEKDPQVLGLQEIADTTHLAREAYDSGDLVSFEHLMNRIAKELMSFAGEFIDENVPLLEISVIAEDIQKEDLSLDPIFIVPSRRR